MVKTTVSIYILPFKLFLLTLLFVLSTVAVSAATVTLATGGGAISADTTGGTFTNLTGPILTETATPNDIDIGTIILNVPSGFVFDTGAPAVTILLTSTETTANKNINSAANNSVLNITSNNGTAITFTVNSKSSGGARNTLTWQNVRVRPTAASPLASGNITKGGTSVVASVANGANFGTLTEVAGTPDTTPPVVTVPAPFTAEATSPAGVSVDFNATALDDVDGVIIPTCVPAQNSTFALGATSVNCSATDAATNTGSAVFTITVVDTADPILTLPSNITTEAVSPSGATVNYMSSVSATDLVDASPSISCDPPEGSFSIGTTLITCTATDDFGNNVTDTFDVIVEDTTPPVLSGMPSDKTEEATSAAGVVVAFTDPTASDIVDGLVLPSCVPVSGSTFPLGLTTVNCTATDSAANSDSETFNVTVQDTTAPSIIAPGDISIEATGPTTIVSLGSPNVSDSVDASPSVSNDAPGAFSVGITTVTWNATDASGNSAVDTQNVTVTDATAPNITILGSNPAFVTVGDTYVDAGATADDLVDGDLTSSISNESTVDTGTIGNYTVTYDVNDTAGNPAATVTRDVNVVAGPDTTPPVVTVPSDMIVEATSALGASVSFNASAVDDVDSAITPVCSPASDSTFELGTTTVNCSATDLSANNGSATFNITVQDTTPPNITILGDNPANVTVGSSYVDASATADDLVDGSNLTIIAGSTVYTGTIGNYTVTYDVNDTAGNPAATKTRIVNVVDTTPPNITILGDNPVYLEVGLWVGYTDAGATAFDNVDGNISGNVSIDIDDVGAASIGVYTVYFNVNDSSGNPAVEVNRTVIFQDTTAPVITLNVPNPINVEAGIAYLDAGATAIDDFDNVTFESNYSGDISDSIIAVSDVNTSALGTYIVTYDVSDSSGNAADQVNRTVNVVDTTPPVITILGSNPATVTVGSVYVDANATALDNLDGNVNDSIAATNGVNTAVIGSYNVTYNVTDFSGNSAQAVRIVNVVAALAPASGGGSGGGGGGSSYSPLSTGHGPPTGNPPAAPAAPAASAAKSGSGGGATLAQKEPDKPVLDVIPKESGVFSGGEITGAVAVEPGSSNWRLWLLLLALIILAIIGIWYSRRNK